MRTALRHALAAAIAGLCLGGVAAAQNLAGPSLGSRLAVNSTEYPWSAIGRVNAGGRGYCTGFMVGERHALTAGRSMFHRREGRLFAPMEIQFVAAYQHDRRPQHSAVRRYALVRGAGLREEWGPHQVGRNWAILELQEPIGRSTGHGRIFG